MATKIEQEVPKCHMKPMIIKKDESGNEFYSCVHCSSTKDLYKEENQMPKTSQEKFEEATRGLPVHDQDESGVAENVETTMIDHQFDISDYEILEIAERIGQIDMDEDSVQAEKKVEMAKWAAKAKDLAAERKRLTRIVREKKEMREVECSWDYDFTAGTVTFHSVETGEFISSREMTGDERQLGLFDKSTSQDESSSFGG